MGSHTYRNPGTYAVRISFYAGLFGTKLYQATGKAVVSSIEGTHVVVSIGDSVASGEGNPVKYRTYIGPVPVQPAWWSDTNQNGSSPCHRSPTSWPALAAKALKSDIGAITFIHLACSGATIQETTDQLKDLKARIEGGSLRLPGNRIDTLLISAGQNNMRSPSRNADGFESMWRYCRGAVNCANDTVLDEEIRESVAALQGEYALLDEYLRDNFDVGNVFITEYYDPTRTRSGEFPSSLESWGCSLDTAIFPGAESMLYAEWEFLYDTMVASLNTIVRITAGLHGWNYVGGIADAFRTHGYCSNKSWVTNERLSGYGQGDGRGTLQPYLRGHEAIALLVVDAVLNAPEPDRLPPVTTAAVTPLAAGDGWHNGEVIVRLSAVDNEDGSGVKEIHVTIGDGQPMVLDGDTAALGFTAEGEITVTYYAVDNRGNTEEEQTVEVRIDRTPPTLSVDLAPTPNGQAWLNRTAHVTATCEDALSGIASCEPASLEIVTEGQNQSVTATAEDEAGNRTGWIPTIVSFRIRTRCRKEVSGT